MKETPSLEDIVSALEREADDADDFYTNAIQPDQEAANNYFEAKPFGDEVEGRSQIVLPDVAEAIGYMADSVLRNFVSGDRVVEIEALDEQDEPAADEATATLDYVFMREQDGFRVLSDWVQSGLLERIGVVKTVCETEEIVTRARVMVDMEQAQALDAGLLLGEGEELDGLTPNEDGTFSADIKRTKIEKRFLDIPIALENFRFSRRARHEDGADYLAHVELKTRSELVEMGFDREQVYELPIASELDRTSSRYSDDMWRDTAELPPELQTVLLREEYARMDVDGDGIAERIKIFRVEKEILTDAKTGEPSLETISEQPFAVFCPFPRAHRLVGNSLADKSMDIQRVRSLVARQMLDGMYLANMPRPLVDMSAGDFASTTVEDLLRPIPGSPIRYKGTPPQPFQSGLDVGKSLSVLEFWTGERETRTGITRLNQGLDADTMNKTATGAALMAAQGQQMEEAVARNFGEAFGRLMAKKMRLMKAEGATFRIKDEGQYRTVDASQWPDDFRLVVRVGLGTGNKTQRVQNLAFLGNIMERMAQGGGVDPRGMFKYGNAVVRALQLGQGDDFFVNPDSPENQGKPDPEQAQAEAAMQGEAAKVQAKTQADMLKVESQMQIDRERMNQEAELRREELATEARLEMMKMQLGGASDARVNNASPGGSLAQ